MAAGLRFELSDYVATVLDFLAAGSRLATGFQLLEDIVCCGWVIWTVNTGYRLLAIRFAAY